MIEAHPNAPSPNVGLESDDELFADWARTGDPLLREELAVRFMGLACSLARRYSDRGERLEDLEQVASLGLLKAIDGYDAIRGTSFRAYAEPTILGELRRHFRDRRWAIRVPRDLKEALPRIRQAIDQLEGQLGREPDTTEVAERAGLNVDEVVEALQVAASTRPASLDAPAARDDPEAPAVAELVGSNDENLEQAEWGVLLEQRLERLDARQREILHLRFVRDLTQREIGVAVGISQMQVSRILRATLEQLRRD